MKKVDSKDFTPHEAAKAPQWCEIDVLSLMAVRIHWTSRWGTLHHQSKRPKAGLEAKDVHIRITFFTWPAYKYNSTELTIDTTSTFLAYNSSTEANYRIRYDERSAQLICIKAYIV